jgi:hypothetical protein
MQYPKVNMWYFTVKAAGRQQLKVLRILPVSGVKMHWTEGSDGINDSKLSIVGKNGLTGFSL